jgi:hypothetical protein
MSSEWRSVELLTGAKENGRERVSKEHRRVFNYVEKCRRVEVCDRSERE